MLGEEYAELNQLLDDTLISFKKRVTLKEAVVCVIGSGYVGVNVAIQHANSGFSVIAFDTNKEKVDKINKGKSYINGVTDEELTQLVNMGKIKATCDVSRLNNADIIIICVPTPLTGNNEPDISYIIEACNMIKNNLRNGQLIILESTTYPGTLEEIVLPILSNNQFKIGQDFFVGYSPERIDIGNEKFNQKNTPKVVSGITKNCLDIIQTFYKQSIKVVPVSSTRSAEFSKLFENLYRSVNIALVNEIAMLCDKMNLDVWEILDASFSKPFGIHPFYPGPGVGGHCIPIDPHYLAWKAKEYNFPLRLANISSEINANMIYFIFDKIIKVLNEKALPIKGSKILILGMAFKKDVSDYRTSPGLNLYKLLNKYSAYVEFYDPFIDIVREENLILQKISLDTENLLKYDVVVIVTDHSCIDYVEIVKYSNCVIDTRNATKNVKDKSKIIYL